jgi:hypothetical protein
MNFSDYTKKYQIQPSDYVKYLLDNNKIGNLSQVSLFKDRGGLLASQEYDRTHELFLRHSRGSHFMYLMQQISLKEKNFKGELKTIAEEAVREIFGIPDYVFMDATLTESSNNFNEELEENFVMTEITDEIQKQIHKRILLNALVHGAALYSWKSTHYIIKEKIDELDPSLIQTYDVFTSLVSMYLFQLESELPFIANGISSVDNEEEQTTIVAKGNSLPVLLHEMVKGVVSLWMQHGIPNELSEEEIRTIYAEADKYEDEYYHYLISPSIWENFLSATNVYPHELAPVVMKLAQLSPEKVEEVLLACIDNKNYAYSLMKLYKIL